MLLIDITGQRYGRLTVLGITAQRSAGRRREVLCCCRCDCGAEILVRSHSVRSGNTKSCGCLHREMTSRAHLIHGERRINGQPSREYRAWRGLTQRCTNPKNPKFASYGGRGIQVCARWEHYENFLTDMGRCPPGCSLDRINNDGPYAPSNCRWATASEQRKNQRTVVR